LPEVQEPLPACCVLGLVLFVGNGPDRCACYPSAHNILHVSLTVYFPVVLSLFKMSHFVVVISPFSGEWNMISHNIKWMVSEGIVWGLGMVVVESRSDMA